LITIKECSGEYYTEEQMLNAYPDKRSHTDREREFRKKEKLAKIEFEDDDFWTRVNGMNSRMMLEKLSGTKWVN
jgi:hypothetical protein